MPDPKFDPDEPVSLFPHAGEEVLKKMLGVEEESEEDDSPAE